MQCYLVGGAVRDELLGYPHSERDWVVVGATPEEMRRAGYKQVGKDFPVFLHPETGEEYALARTERKSGHGYGGFQFNTDPSVTLEQDLTRRDLTINAMARTKDDRLVDPYGGRDDLDARLLRHVSPAFTEDPLRVLRVARFAARYAHLGFRIADETLQLMRAISGSGELQHLVPERVWRETERALGERDPQVFFITLHDCAALPIVFPELTPLLADEAPTELQRIAADEADPRVRLALFLRRLDTAAVVSLAERVKMPKAFTELALLLARHAMDCGQRLDATAALALLESTDAFRRDERFALFLRACRQLDAAWTNRLQKAWQRARDVDTAALLAQGFEGKALGAAIQRRRREIIEETLHER